MRSGSIKYDSLACCLDFCWGLLDLKAKVGLVQAILINPVVRRPVGGANEEQVPRE